MMGPQWLCDCNESGGAATVDEAAKGAAQHFLGHDYALNSYSVAVYRERGEWLYTVSSEAQAIDIAHPLQVVTTHASGTFSPFQAVASNLKKITEVMIRTTEGVSTFNAQVEWDIEPLPSIRAIERMTAGPRKSILLPQGIELGELTAEEAAEEFFKMFSHPLNGPGRVDWGKSRRND